MQTPSVPVSWAWAPAANAPTSSWRTPIHSSRSSRRIASVIGFSASPTTPQTVRTPSPASASTMRFADVAHAALGSGARAANVSGSARSQSSAHDSGGSSISWPGASHSYRSA